MTIGASARNVACVDFDGTLYPWGPILSEPDPLPGAVAAMKRLESAGFAIVIFTSRLSQSWLDESGYVAADQLAHIERLLTRDGIPYHRITSEKVPAEFYVDDRAIRFADNWNEVADWILFSREPA